MPCDTAKSATDSLKDILVYWHIACGVFSSRVPFLDKFGITNADA